MATKSSSKSPDDYEFSIFGLGFGLVTGCLLITAGLIAFVYGASELVLGSVGQSTDFLFPVDKDVWGVVRVFGGLGMIAAGVNLFLGKSWARVVGMVVAFIWLVLGLLSFQDGPVFAIALVVVNACILWALGFHWRDIQEVSQ